MNGAGIVLVPQWLLFNSAPSVILRQHLFVWRTRAALFFALLAAPVNGFACFATGGAHAVVEGRGDHCGEYMTERHRGDPGPAPVRKRRLPHDRRCRTFCSMSKNAPSGQPQHRDRCHPPLETTEQEACSSRCFETHLEVTVQPQGRRNLPTWAPVAVDASRCSIPPSELGRALGLSERVKVAGLVGPFSGRLLPPSAVAPLTGVVAATA